MGRFCGALQFCCNTVCVTGIAVSLVCSFVFHSFDFEHVHFGEQAHGTSGHHEKDHAPDLSLSMHMVDKKLLVVLALCVFLFAHRHRLVHQTVAKPLLYLRARTWVSGVAQTLRWLLDALWYARAYG